VQRRVFGDDCLIKVIHNIIRISNLYYSEYFIRVGQRHFSIGSYIDQPISMLSSWRLPVLIIPALVEVKPVARSSRNQSWMVGAGWLSVLFLISLNSVIPSLYGAW
jgi:hypothetical protein